MMIYPDLVRRITTIDEVQKDIIFLGLLVRDGMFLRLLYLL